MSMPTPPEISDGSAEQESGGRMSFFEHWPICARGCFMHAGAIAIGAFVGVAIAKTHSEFSSRRR